MMKTRIVLFAIMAVVIALTSCKNLEKILPKNEGTWTATTATISITEDGNATVTDSTANLNGSVIFQFNDDGTGVYTEDGQSSDFDWTYNEESEQISVDTDGFILTYDVLECSKNSMTLFFTFEIEFFGIKIKTDTTMDLEKSS